MKKIQLHDPSEYVLVSDDANIDLDSMKTNLKDIAILEIGKQKISGTLVHLVATSKIVSVSIEMNNMFGELFILLGSNYEIKLNSIVIGRFLFKRLEIKNKLNIYKLLFVKDN